MSAYIRNFEIIPTIGSYVVDIDLGVSSVPLSGVVNFISLPGLTSFKMKNAAFERFENVLSCSGLNVFDLADSHITLNTIVSCLSVFADRKCIYPELTGNIYLSGAYMPLLYREPATYNLDYEFKRLYDYLISGPLPWRVVVNYEPEVQYINTNNETISVYTTATKSSYVIVSSEVTNFNFKVNNFNGIYANNYYNVSALSACFITLTGTPQLTADANILYVGQNTTLSAIDGTLHTFYYFATGSLLLGVGSKYLPLKPLTTKPVTIISDPLIYTPPARYGYIDGTVKKSFNVNTLNKQTTYVILNTATKLFSLKINETNVLSAYNQFRNTTNLLSTSYIGITGIENFQTTTKTLSYQKQTGLTATNLSAFDIKYFYAFNNKVVLGIASRSSQEILEPTDMYDRYLIQTSLVEVVTAEPMTQLPPVAIV